ncbi:glycosyltransferase family 4 protein [Streptomyces sp. NPDC007861]|uniref:glycosyltransferase family 4 protein n=1 Tax=Streptomyces sp. NPDC007861 TaxID=3154893 RepID=UPI0033DFABFD
MPNATIYLAVTIKPQDQSVEAERERVLPDDEPQLQGISRERGMKELKNNNFLWTNVKEAFAKGGPEEAILSVGRLRSHQVNKMLTDLGDRNRDLSFCAVGSTNPTSDYDITVGGRGDIQAMKDFNTEFVKWIKEKSGTACDYESGMVFDTNLYVAGYLPVVENIRATATRLAFPPQQVSKAELHAASSERRDRAGQDLSKVKAATPDDDKLLWDGVTEDDFEKNLEPAVLRLSEERQDVYALTKLRKYCGPTEWVDFGEKLKDAMTKANTEWAATNTRLTSAEGLVAKYVDEVLKNCNTTPNQDPKKREDDLERLEEESGVSGANKVLHARNNLYAEYSEKARKGFLDFRKEYVLKAKPANDVSTWEEARKRSYVSAMDNFALSLMFAMEAYHSGSAIKDVVANQQANRGLSLTRSQYRDSFNEQTGDFLKDLHHYQNKPPKALIQASKYLSRICLAGTEVNNRTSRQLGEDVQKSLENFTKLTCKNPESELLKIRKPDAKYAEMSENERGEAAAGVYRSAMGEDYYMDKMKKRVMELNVAINAGARDEATEKRKILVVCDMSGQAGGGVPVFNMKFCGGLAENDMFEVYLLTVQQPAGGDSYEQALKKMQDTHPKVNIALVPNPNNRPFDDLRTLLEDAIKNEKRGYRGLPKEANDVYAVIGHSRFSGPAAQAITSSAGWYPSAKYAHIVHTPSAEVGVAQGKEDKGILNFVMEVSLFPKADVGVGVGNLLFDTVEKCRKIAGVVMPAHELIPGTKPAAPVSKRVKKGKSEALDLLLIGRADDPLKDAATAVFAIDTLQRAGNKVKLKISGVPEREVNGFKETLALWVDLQYMSRGVEVEILPYTLTPSELIGRIRSVDAVIMPSLVEGFGLAATEALEQGVPALVTEWSGAARFIADKLPESSSLLVVKESGMAERHVTWATSIANLKEHLDQAYDYAGKLRETLGKYSWKDAGTALISAISSPQVNKDTRQVADGQIQYMNRPK